MKNGSVPLILDMLAWQATKFTSSFVTLGISSYTV